MGRKYESQPLFQNTFNLRRSRAANFADVIEIPTTFPKTTLKDSEKAKRTKNYALKCNQYFLI